VSAVRVDSNQAKSAPVAVVSGASSGIGAAIARQLAANGYAVVLVARREAALVEVATTIERAGGAALVVPGDAAEATAMQQVVAKALAWRGRLDVVVANAGVYHRGPATELTRAQLETALRDNFWTAFHLVEAALPAVRQARGSLFFVNSFDAKKGLPLDAAYATAKCALAGYAATLRQALRADGVHVGTAFPGRVDTPMIAHVDVPAVSAKISPERVARAVVRGIRRRRAEVIVPWHCRFLWWVDVLSPRLGDWLVARPRLDGTVPRQQP
jgi:short-subunit dehydrogenase